MKRLSGGIQMATWIGLAMVVALVGRLVQPANCGDAETASQRSDSDRGDVPGWVMITMMTSIVVIALLVVFREAVTKAVQDAFDAIVG